MTLSIDRFVHLTGPQQVNGAREQQEREKFRPPRECWFRRWISHIGSLDKHKLLRSRHSFDDFYHRTALILCNFSYDVGRYWAYDILEGGHKKGAQSMYNHILVPVDGSETSLLGLQHAILLAKDQKAALRLLHVVHDYLLADGRHALVISDELLKDLREHGQTVLNDAANIARRQGVEAEPECIESPMGPVGAVIAKCAEQWPADLIVLGTHGRRGIRRLVMGSDAEYVVRTTRVPVLLVRGTKAPPKD